MAHPWSHTGMSTHRPPQECVHVLYEMPQERAWQSHNILSMNADSPTAFDLIRTRTQGNVSIFLHYMNVWILLWFSSIIYMEFIVLAKNSFDHDHFRNNIDLDQLASDEASWSGSILFLNNWL